MPSPRPFPLRRAAVRGFSTIELMVAAAILLLLIVAVAEMVNNTTQLSNASQRQLQADDAARMVFDRMALDFDKIVNRRDVDYIFSKQAGNDAMFFYSEAPAFTTSTSGIGTVALIGYRVAASGSGNGIAVPGLQRLGKRLNVDGAATTSGSAGGMVFVSKSGTHVDATSTLDGHWTSIGTESAGYTDGTDTNYHVLSPQVVRMEIAFLLKPYTDASGAVHSGTLSKTFYDTRQGHTDTTGANYRGLDDVVAIVVGLAILDSSSQKIVGNAGVYTNLTSTLIDCDSFSSTSLIDTDSSGLMEPVWNKIIESKNFASETGLPKTAASQVRAYQRFFYLK